MKSIIFKFSVIFAGFILASFLSRVTFNLIFLKKIKSFWRVDDGMTSTVEILLEPISDVMRNNHLILRTDYMIKTFVIFIGLSSLLFILKRYFLIAEDPLKSKYFIFLFILVYFWKLYGMFDLVIKL